MASCLGWWRRRSRWFEMFYLINLLYTTVAYLKSVALNYYHSPCHIITLIPSQKSDSSSFHFKLFSFWECQFAPTSLNSELHPWISEKHSYWSDIEYWTNEGFVQKIWSQFKFPLWGKMQKASRKKMWKSLILFFIKIWLFDTQNTFYLIVSKMHFSCHLWLSKWGAGLLQMIIHIDVHSHPVVSDLVSICCIWEVWIQTSVNGLDFVKQG